MTAVIVLGALLALGLLQLRWLVFPPTPDLAAEIDQWRRGRELATMRAGTPDPVSPLGRLSLSELAEFLREVASQAWLAKYPRTVRGPKKPPPRRTSGRTNHHVSTARLLHKQIQLK